MYYRSSSPICHWPSFRDLVAHWHTCRLTGSLDGSRARILEALVRYKFALCLGHGLRSTHNGLALAVIPQVSVLHEWSHASRDAHHVT